MEPNNYPKDPIEEGKPPLDLENDLYEDDPYEDYDFLDEDSFLEEEVDDPYEGLDDIYDPMDDDDDYDSFDELERLGLY